MPTYNFGLISVMSHSTKDMGTIDLGSDTDARRYAIQLLSNFPNKKLSAGMYDKGIAVVRIEKNRKRQVATIAQMGEKSFADLKSEKYGGLDIRPLNKDGTYKKGNKTAAPFGL